MPITTPCERVEGASARGAWGLQLRTIRLDSCQKCASAELCTRGSAGLCSIGLELSPLHVSAMPSHRCTVLPCPVRRVYLLPANTACSWAGMGTFGCMGSACKLWANSECLTYRLGAFCMRVEEPYITFDHIVRPANAQSVACSGRALVVNSAQLAPGAS